MEIKVGYKTFKVTYRETVKYKSKPVNGYIDFEKNKIVVCNKILSEEQDQILVHELLHAIESVYNLEFTEKQIDAMATGLLSIAKQNTDLILKLLGIKRLK